MAGTQILPKLDKPRIAELVGGFGVSYKYYEKLDEERVRFYSPEFQNLMNLFKEKAKLKDSGKKD